MHPSRLFTTCSTRRGFVPAALLLASSLLCVGGCETKGWIDPTEMGRLKREPLAIPILDSIDPTVEPERQQFASAIDPQPEDYKASAGDYTISQNDGLQVAISDLQGPGQETVKQSRVNDSGNISLPFIGSIHVAGLTEIEAEQSIVEAYRNANLIQNAQVSVTVVDARGRTFSIMGAVQAPAQYAILDSNFRVLNALVLARDTVANYDLPYLYIIRQNNVRAAAPARGPETTPAVPPAAPAPAPAPEDLKPKSELPHTGPALAFNGGQPRYLLADAPADPAAAPAAPAPAAAPTPAPAATTPASAPAANTPVPEAATAPAPAATAPVAGSSGQFEFSAPPDVDSSTRVIRIPLTALRAGDIRYNIPVRANDLLIVPNPESGEFYMGGHVQRPGAFTLTGRRITLKEAVVSAGMLDGLAIPQRTDIIRRVKPDHEIFVRVDLAKIFAGEQPDIFLRPYDQVQVGTNALAPFIAAARGAFRMTYGFGFLYDRNFYTGNGSNGF